MTDRGTFANSVGWAIQPDESTRRGHAKIVEVTTDKSTSFAGLAGLLEEWPPEWDDEPIQIYIGGGSARLTKSTFKRTVTEEFDYEEEDGQFAREGTIEDVTQRTAESLAAMQGADQDRATFASRNDNGRATTDKFVGTFVEDGSGRTASGTATGDQKTNAANKNTYTTTLDTEDATGFSTGFATATSANKYRSDGTSSGAMQIAPTGATTGPISFHANDLSRVNDGGTSLLIRDTNGTLNGVNTKTLTTEGGTGRIRGEVTGKSNGVVRTSPSPVAGEGAADATTNVSAVLAGDDHGNGFFIQSTVKTNPTAGTKDTELIVSRGSSQADPAGTSSGVVKISPSSAAGEGLGEGASSIKITATSTGKGKSNQTTTRVLTSVAPGKRTHFTVTRTDAGEGTTSSTGTVTIEDGQTERTGNFNSNSEAKATAVYSHRGSYGEDSPYGLPAYQDSGSGTLTTKVNTSYSGDSKSTNDDSTFTLTVNATQNSTEDSTYTLGWTQQGVDTAGQDFYTGETATETVNSRGNTSGTTEIVDGVITAITLNGGSNRSTEQNTFRKWDYRAKDDFFSRLDEATQSTVTTRSGADEEGNPSLSQSIVNERQYDFISQSKTVGPYGPIGSYVDTHTEAQGQKEVHSQTATSSGPADNRRQNLAIDRAFESYDETADVGIWDWGLVDDHTDRFELEAASRTDKSESSSYRSTHLVDENGLARDGEFTATSRTTVTTTGPKSAPTSSDPAYNRRYDYTYYGPDSQAYLFLTWDTEETAGLSSQVTTTTNETGSYYDASSGVRVQSGDYKIDERSQLDDFYTLDEYVYEEVPTTGEWQTRTKDGVIRVRNTSLVTTTGSYGPGGISESREYLHTLTDRSNSVTRQRDSFPGWADTHIRYSLTYQNDNGQISGHEYHKVWTVDENGVDVWEPVIDRDIYDGTPPSGPVGGLSYVVHSPPGEQTGAGLDGEEQPGGFQPGTIDVDLLQQRAGEALQIGYDYLDAEWRKKGIEWELRELQDDLERGWRNGDRTFIEKVDKEATRKKIQDLERQVKFLAFDLQQFRNRLDEDYGDIEFQGFDFWTPSENLEYVEGGHGADAIIRQAQYGPMQGSIPLGLQSTGGPGDLLAFGMAGILKGVGRELAATSAGNVAKNEVRGFAKPKAVPTQTVAPQTSTLVRSGSIKNNPANRVLDVPTRDLTRLRPQRVRITAEDAQRYRDAVADRYNQLLKETPSELTDEARRAWRFEKLNQFRREWLDDFYKSRPY